ncbi:MAG TPA: hypothetical protein VFR81_24580 [Longimicrobium sp.]|nr:hypothetical protein [Longimicrobium sp.]
MCDVHKLSVKVIGFHPRESRLFGVGTTARLRLPVAEDGTG